MKALIVDDELINRKFLNAIISDFGDCDQASNGNEAVAFVKNKLNKNEMYDLIFLDIMMPELDGHETLTKIRKVEEEANILIGNGSTIIMISCLEDNDNIISSFREGCEYYLVKPLLENIVLDLLRELRHID